MSALNEERIYCVYFHINKVSNKTYIGQTRQRPEERWKNDGRGYLGKYENGEYNQPLMARAVLKYDWNNDWEHVIFADNLSADEANNLEKRLISLYQTNHPKYGYNIHAGGADGASGRIVSEETKRKISESLKGRRPSPLAIEKSRSYNTGIVRSNETRAKIATAKIGNKNPIWGKIGENNHSSIPICQCDGNWNVLCFYWNAREAERETGINSHNIYAVCSGNKSNRGYARHTAGGYRWRYATEEEINNAKNIIV